MMTLPKSHNKRSIPASEAASELLRRRKARRSMLSFVEYVNQAYETNWHHARICAALDQLAEGSISKLMVFSPPQHGKSELVSRRLPAYLLGRDPDLKIVAASYAAELIQGMNRDVQRTIDSDAYRRLFPETTLNRSNVRTESGGYLRNNDIFEIVSHRGQYRCAGVGGGLTGFPADVAIIDDPYKDYQEAMSPTTRQAVQDWYSSVLLTRCHNTTRHLLTLTRWHPQDLAGWLLDVEGDASKGGAWTVVRLPALADPELMMPDDPRQVGEALWPSRFSVETLHARKKLTPRKFESLYQQNPKPRSGAMFPGTIERVAAVPYAANRVRRWDLAATEGGGDWTVGLLMAQVGGIFYIEDYTAFQHAPHERNKRIREVAERDARRYGNTVRIIGPQDPGAAGVEAAMAFIRMLAGYPVETVIETGSKEVRAEPLSDAWGAGNVKILEAAWNQQYLERMELFPHGGRDEGDVSSGAFNYLALGWADQQQEEIVIYDEPVHISSI